MHMKFGQSDARGKQNIFEKSEGARFSLFGLNWGLSSHSGIFHSYADVTIAGERLLILTCSALVAIEQGGFFGVPHLL